MKQSARGYCGFGYRSSVGRLFVDDTELSVTTSLSETIRSTLAVVPYNTGFRAELHSSLPNHDPSSSKERLPLLFLHSASSG
jgi:hypothetical protein